MRASINVVKEIINQRLKGIPLTDNCLNEDLFKGGIDLNSLICIIASLEDKYDCEIPDSKQILLEMNTVYKIKSLLDECLKAEK